jgi:hypothetical protein
VAIAVERLGPRPEILARGIGVVVMVMGVVVLGGVL